MVSMLIIPRSVFAEAGRLKQTFELCLGGARVPVDKMHCIFRYKPVCESQFLAVERRMAHRAILPRFAVFVVTFVQDNERRLAVADKKF